MTMVKVPKGQRFVKRGEKMNNLFLIVQGRVRQLSTNDSVELGNGNLIGIMECRSGIFACDYVAIEETTLYSYVYEKIEDFATIFEEQSGYALAFLRTTLKQTSAAIERCNKQEVFCRSFYLFLVEKYKKYQELSEKYGLPQREIHHMEQLSAPTLLTDSEKWENRYFKKLTAMKSAELAAFYGESKTLVIGEMLRASKHMECVTNKLEELREYLQYKQGILLGNPAADLYGAYVELAEGAAALQPEIADIRAEIEQLQRYMEECGLYEELYVEKCVREYEQLDFSNIYEAAYAAQEEVYEEEEEDCLEHILNYAGYTAAEIAQIRELFVEYRRMDTLTADAARRIRNEITQIFYMTYTKVFRNTVKDMEDSEDERPSTILLMFLHFGFMDVQTAGEENANLLYDLTERLFLCKAEHIYTVYDWLLAIYKGEQEPSRNEFDLDYMGYLHEQRRMGKINELQERLLKDDNMKKAEYEIANMFRSTNRAVYGRVSQFCPVFSKRDATDALEEMLVTVHKIEHAMDEVRKYDFSVFYHDVAFSAPENGINQEILKKEIMPNVILMPTIGVRAMMWQESAGTKRDTSARFIFPIFTMENIDDMMLETCGRYRWEMCRKTQGMRWNDISERSLTSEYCDYLQYYRKKHELTIDAKEKIRNELIRAKNNYREVFVADYISWIRYESSGNFRLNQIARDMMFRYCPLRRSLRENLADNPMYQNLNQKFDTLFAREQKRAQLFTDKYIKNGGEMTVELQANLDFYSS